MKKFLLSLAISLFFVIPAQAMTLTDFYGGHLPTIADRIGVATEAGITNYSGTYTQNVKLLTYLQSKSVVKTDLSLGATPASTTVNQGYNPVTGYLSHTTSFISATATTIPVVSTNDKSGNPIVLSNISSATVVRVYMNLESGTSKEEPVICTGLTATSWTGCVRGVPFQSGDETSSTTIATSHNAGASIIITNLGQFYNQFVSVDGTATINGVKTFAQFPLVPTSTPTNGAQVVSYSLLQSVTSTGCSNAIEGGRGCVDLATRAQMANGTSLGNLSASLVLQSKYASSTSPSATTTVVITSSTGKIDSSFGGATSSLATLNSSVLVVQNPANATSTATASSIPISTASSSLDTWVNDNMQVFTASATVAASGTPQAVYLDYSTGNVTQTNAASATTTFPFVGFVPIGVSMTTNTAVTVQVEGLVSGFTGLTPGASYFLSNTTSSIATTAGTLSLKVGTGTTSTTKLLIQRGLKVTTGVAAFSSSVSSTVFLGYRPTSISISAEASGSNSFFSFSSGGWTENGQGGNGNNLCVYGNFTAGTTAQGQSASAWHVTDNGTSNNMDGQVQNVTDRSFVLSNIKNSSGPTTNISWIATGY